MFKFINQINERNGIKQASSLQPFVSMLSGAGEGQFGDNETYKQSYQKIIIVYRCIDLIASNLAALPIKIWSSKDRDQRIDLSDSAEFVLFKKPNQYQSRQQFWIEAYSRLKMQGELFIELNFASNGRIAGMFADWKSEDVKIVANKEEGIKHFELRRNNKVYTYSPEQVFYIRYFNPFSQWRGMSPLMAGRDVLTLELHGTNYNKNFFKQGMKLSGVLQTEQELQTEAAKRIKEDWEKIYSGVANMHRIAMAWGGLKFTPVQQMNLRDAEFVNLKKLDREELAMLFGVPLEMLGIGKSTFANWQEARRSFWSETLIPEASRLSEVLTSFLLPRLTQREVYAEFDFSNIEALKDNLSDKLNRYRDGFNTGAVTPNDVRVDIFGKDAIKHPAMDTTYLPANMIPVGEEEPDGKSIKKKV